MPNNNPIASAIGRMNSTLKTNLRFGWTTGTCATAAAFAAYRAMVSGEFPDTVAVDTPSGKTAELEIASTASEDGRFTASVVKDAGDDPDVTHGAEIRVTITEGESGSGVVFRAGEGVGIVTKAGLPIGVGEPAVNPVPRQMMEDCIGKLADELEGPRRRSPCGKDLESAPRHRRRHFHPGDDRCGPAVLLFGVDRLDSPRH